MHRIAACLAAWVVAGCSAPAGQGAASHGAGDIAASAEPAPRPGLVVNLYRDAAVVWDRRLMELVPGRGQVAFAPVPGAIAAGSATLVSLTDAMAVRVLGPARHDLGERQLSWDIDTARGAGHLLEAAYATDAIAWQAGYELVLDASRRRAHLRGTLTIDNRTDMDMQAATVRVTGAPRAGQESATSGQPGALPAWFMLAQPVSIPAGRVTRYPMLDQGRAVAVAVRLFHDPVGAELDYRGLRPMGAKSYGDAARRESTAVVRRLELDRDSAPWIAALPAGELVVLDGAASGPRDNAKQPGHDRLARAPEFAPGDDAAVVLEPAPEWSARRWQSDFLHDPHARRVVEEIRVKIDSRAAEPAVVVVREHLYRGLNWTIAYHNDVVAARKEGPQAVRFEVAVPARGSALLVYRVVYAW